MSGDLPLESELLTLIREYFQCNEPDFDATLKSFENDVIASSQKRTFAENVSLVEPGSNEEEIPSWEVTREKFIDAFKNGSRKNWYDLWHKWVPEEIKSVDTEAQKLEFYINIHFAVFPLRGFSEDNAEQAMVITSDITYE